VRFEGTRGANDVFEINPLTLWTIVKHPSSPDVARKQPPALHVSADLSAAASDADCTAA
jgi:hypothetical protein